MKVILLSGGSGKRLWPLSNNTRSKQFLRLLSAPNGEKESMVQRVARQIKEASLTDTLTIATSANQKDIITIQLGDNINLVTEPERRDTFPAIALASAYLALEKKCSDDETIIVMPCDPYTEDSYFSVIADMAKAVERNVADLVLMGIKPTYASTKFGYIVPEKEDKGKDILKVEGFTEKPTEKRAKDLLEMGAFWNSGVFAFRLSYMMDIIRNYRNVETYKELYANFRSLPKISFDYEVAEKAKSIAMLPFDGEWKDLGTWNAISEKLSDDANGNVVLGTDCEHTHVINELNEPMLCVGTKNLLIAATPDGILVCDKDYSEQIKNYVNKLEARPMYEKRRWGKYKVIDYSTQSDGHQVLTKRLKINAGANISYQIHRHRDEVWTFVDGTGLLVLDGKVIEVERGDVINIKKGQLHAVKAITELCIIEVQSGDMLVEEDIERYPWEWAN